MFSLQVNKERQTSLLFFIFKYTMVGAGGMTGYKAPMPMLCALQ